MPKPPKTYNRGGQFWLIKTKSLVGGTARSRDDGPAEISNERPGVWKHVWFTGDREMPTRRNGPWLLRTNGEILFVRDIQVALTSKIGVRRA